jgi:hypothetical protein
LDLLNSLSVKAGVLAKYIAYLQKML